MSDEITYTLLQPMKRETSPKNIFSGTTRNPQVTVMNEMDFSKICRVCLSPLATVPLVGELHTIFAQLSGIMPQHPVFPMSLCGWCVTLLRKCQGLRNMSLRAHNQLQQMYTYGTLNVTNILQIDRKLHGLTYELNTLTVSPTVTIPPQIYKIKKHKKSTDNQTVEVKVESLVDEFESDNYLIFHSKEKKEEVDEEKSDSKKLDPENDDSKVIQIAKVDDLDDLKDNTDEDDNYTPANDYNWSDDSDSDLEKPLNKLKLIKELTDFTSDGFLQQIDQSIQSFKEEVLEESLQVKKKKIKSSKKSPKSKPSKKSKNDTKPKLRIKKEGSLEDNVEDLARDKPKDTPKSGKGARSENMEIKRNLDKWFTVRKLTSDEQYEEFEKRKQNKAYTTRQYKCEFCYNGFSSQSVFDKHMEKHKERPDLPYSCPLCRFYYPDKRGLVRHALVHQKLFHCRSCDYVTDSCHMAILHVNWHNGKEYKCKHCPDVFKLLPTLVNHVRIKHPSDHVCTLCGYSFVGDKGLAAHRKLKHDGQDLTVPETGPMCIECNIRFLNEDALGTHHAVSLKHENFGRRVNNNASQARSIEYKPFGTIDGPRPRAREVLRPVDCEKCGVTLRSYRQYQMHFRKQHPNDTRTQFSKKTRPVLCDLCGKTFPKPYFLREHMNEHTQTVTHKCEYCDKTYSNRFKYLKHRAVHRGVRYSCPTCPMTFNNPSNRYRHVKYVHSNERNVKCQFCEKCFKSEAELKLHTDHVHFKKPWPKRSRKTREDGTGRIDCRRKRDGHMLIGYDTSSDYEPHSDAFMREKDGMTHLV